LSVGSHSNWCRLNRHLPIAEQYLPIAEQYRVLSQKLRGHFAYYGGVIGNLRCLHRFRYEAMRLWRKWLSRRRRRGQRPWERFNRLLRALVLPWPRGWVPPCAVKP
jgi:hypothetical protein